jgi:hypothetical protein
MVLKCDVSSAVWRCGYGVMPLTKHLSAQKYERIVFDDADPKRVGVSSNAIPLYLAVCSVDKDKKAKRSKNMQKEGKKVKLSGGESNPGLLRVVLSNDKQKY